jgi:serine/threonine-protein kinase RsbW
MQPLRRKHAPEYKITVASKLENLGKIGNFLGETGNLLALPPELLADVQTAVDEACTNIIQHAYGMRADRPITIGCRLRNAEFIVRIRDFGQPFAPDLVPVPDPDAGIRERRVAGYGVFLMKRLMNRVKYRFDERRGNELTMVKRLPVAGRGSNGD